MTTSAQINILLQSILAAHLIFVATWLATVPRSPRPAAIVLAMFLIGNAGPELVDILQLLGILREQTWIVGIYVPWTYALPPLLYLYTCTLTDPGARPGRLLAIGPLVALLFTLPYLAMEAAQRATVLDVGYLSLDSSPAMTRIPLELAVLVTPLYATGYLVACFVHLRRHMRAMEGFFSHIADKTHSWLRWVLLLMCAAVAAGALDTFSEPLLGYHLVSDTTSNLIEALWIYPLTFLALAQPTTAVSDADRADVREASLSPPRKYARSALADADLKRIAGRLQQAMTDSKLYKDPALTLRGLSEHTGVPSNYLSQTLSVELGCSFFDFVNQWRVRDACDQLASPERSVIAISEDVGFQSRSTFNAAFKKQTGQTPSAYRKHVTSSTDCPAVI